VGNLGKDPEIRQSADGLKVVSFSIATGESWKDKATGERRDRTEWHRVVILNDRIGEIAEKYLKKGSKVYIEGQLQTRKWTDQNNQEKYTTEVLIGRFRGELTLLDSKSQSTSYSADSTNTGGSSDYSTHSQAAPHGFDELNDEVPF
jgi:single-strand DNA-binding protein